MDSVAWLALSPTAKALYPILKRLAGHYGQKNGAFFLSARKAAEYLGVTKDTASRAFQDLQAKGFLVAVSVGSLGVDGEGKATTWLLTEVGSAANPIPTKKLKDWKPGEDFAVARGKRPIRKQNPVQ